MAEAEKKILETVRSKCMIPNFNNVRELEEFQNQALNQLESEYI